MMLVLEREAKPRMASVGGQAAVVALRILEGFGFNDWLATTVPPSPAPIIVTHVSMTLDL